MDQFLDALKQVAVFMVAAKVILLFFPGNKYERYGKMMVTLIALSMLAVPLLTFLEKEAGTAFWEEVDRLESENEMFSRKLEGLSDRQESIVESGVALSVEEKVQSQAQEAGVTVRDVYIDGGIVVIEVEKNPDGGDGGQILIGPVEVGESRTAEDAGAWAAGMQDRADLAKIFAGQLGMEEGTVKVIER